MLAQRAVAKAVDEELAATEDLEQRLIVIVEEVEAAIVMLALFDRVGDLRQRLDARSGIIDRGEELDVAVVGCAGAGGQVGSERVDRLSKGSELEYALTVALLHHAVVSEESDIVRRGLDAKNEAVLVVHLDRGWSEIVANTRSFEAEAVTPSGEVAARLALADALGRVPKERGDIVDLDRVNSRSEEVVVERSQIFCAAEDDVGGVLGLQDAPVIVAERLDIRKVPSDDSVEPGV